MSNTYILSGGVSKRNISYRNEYRRNTRIVSNFIRVLHWIELEILKLVAKSF